MGLLSGGGSFVRYAVEGALPEHFWDFVAERVALHSFKDIDESYDERSIGWVSVFDMFDSGFAHANYAAGDYVALALRVDERKVSAAALKKFCMKEESRVKREKEIPRLSKAKRLEIKENMTLMLMKRAVPVPSVYELVWNLADMTLLFFSTNKKAQAMLEDYFHETFGLRIVLQVPYNTAEHLLGAERGTELAGLNPELFI